MALSDAELVIGGFGQLPNAVSQTAQYNENYGPTSPAYKDLYTRLANGEISLDEAKRQHLVNVGIGGAQPQQPQPEAQPTPGLANPAMQQPGDTPLPTSTPVPGPGGAVAPVPNPAQHRPLIHRSESSGLANMNSSPMPKPVEVDDPSVGLDRAAQPLSQRNPALAAAPPPPAPAPQRQTFAVPQTRAEAREVAPLLNQISTERNHARDSKARVEAANVGADARTTSAATSADARTEAARIAAGARNHWTDTWASKQGEWMNAKKEIASLNGSGRGAADDVKALSEKGDRVDTIRRQLASIIGSLAYAGGDPDAVRMVQELDRQAQQAVQDYEVWSRIVGERRALQQPLPGQPTPPNPMAPSRAVIRGKKAKPAVDPKDAQALAWVKANPNNPAAAAIKAKLKSKGIKVK